MRDCERLVPVLLDGARVPCLFVRGLSLTVCKQIRGRRYLQRVETAAPLDPGKLPTKQQVRGAVSWMREWEQDVLDGRWEEMRRQEKVAVQMASVGDVLRAYERAAGRLGRPSADTVRMNQGALRKVVRVGLGVEDADRVSAEELTGRLVARFAEAELEGAEDEVSRRRSIVSWMRQARSVFAPRLVQEYEGLTLPDLKGFLERVPVDAEPVKRAPFTVEEVEIIRGGAGLKGPRPDLYAVWALAYFCALRAGEIVQVRREWIRKRELTAVQAEAGKDWLGGRSWCWVLDLGMDPAAQLKTASSAGAIPLADEVAAEVLGLCEGREFVVPGETETKRRDAVNREFPEWLRKQGWPRAREGVQELRAYRRQVWAQRYDDYAAKRWCRHAVQGVDRHYESSDVFVGRRPLGLAD